MILTKYWYWFVIDNCSCFLCGRITHNKSETITECQYRFDAVNSNYSAIKSDNPENLIHMLPAQGAENSSTLDLWRKKKSSLQDLWGNEALRLFSFLLLIFPCHVIYLQFFLKKPIWNWITEHIPGFIESLPKSKGDFVSNFSEVLGILYCLSLFLPLFPRLFAVRCNQASLAVNTDVIMIWAGRRPNFS